MDSFDIPSVGELLCNQTTQTWTKSIIILSTKELFRFLHNPAYHNIRDNWNINSLESGSCTFEQEKKFVLNFHIDSKSSVLDFKGTTVEHSLPNSISLPLHTDTSYAQNGLGQPYPTYIFKRNGPQVLFEDWRHCN